MESRNSKANLVVLGVLLVLMTLLASAKVAILWHRFGSLAGVLGAVLLTTGMLVGMLFQKLNGWRASQAYGK